MMYTTLAIAALAGAAAARQCLNVTVPVQVSARNGVFNLATPVTNIDVTNFILDLTQQGTNYSANILEGYQTVTGNYTIAATYCHPDSGPSNVVQILTHGIGFDRSYWDLSFNNYNYSYVQTAVDEYGYSTFSWDRLGVGASSHGEPVNEIQALLEVDALRALTMNLRLGTIPGVSHKFCKILHTGHSFGAQHSYALTAMYPTISDGIALTGFSQNGTFVPWFALGSGFVQANSIDALSAFPNGYLAPGLPTGGQIDFFSPGQFDPEILALAASTGQPVTVGELLTFGGEVGSINNFAGPTLIITGNRDIPYCGGNCLAPPTGYSSIPATSVNFIPNAKAFEVVIVPNAGHGLNLEYSHPFTYATINNYFGQNGVAANATCPSGSAFPSVSASVFSVNRIESQRFLCVRNIRFLGVICPICICLRLCLACLRSFSVNRIEFQRFLCVRNIRSLGVICPICICLRLCLAGLRSFSVNRIEFQHFLCVRNIRSLGVIWGILIPYLCP
ncbi:hypothetical protein LTR28_007177 [Elasticomyces elasticus]|nr:hypothetical protein LTR28_007177 [Elasticomyces elasticus]